MKDDLRSVQVEAGLRRCALVLHGMAPEDRRWLLTQLDPAHRAALDSLVEDLCGLGVTPDPQLLRELLGPVRRVRAVAATRAGDAQLAQTLGREPASLVALALKDHPDLERVLSLLDVSQRREVLAQQAKRSGPVPPRLAACLREEVDRRLRDQAAPLRGNRWSAAWSRVLGVFL